MYNKTTNIIVANVRTGEILQFPDSKTCSKYMGISVENIILYINKKTFTLYGNFHISKGKEHSKKIFYEMNINQNLYDKLQQVCKKLPASNIIKFTSTILNDFVFNYKFKLGNVDKNLIQNFKNVDENPEKIQKSYENSKTCENSK
jgi:hypothetical protein